MERLTMRMEDGSYQANNDTKFGGENSYSYKNGIIERCGVLEFYFKLKLLIWIWCRKI